MKTFLILCLFLTFPSSALAQSWQEWIEKNPTYPNGVPSTSRTSRPTPKPEANIAEQVFLTSAKITKTHYGSHFLEGRIKNNTDQYVEHVFIDFLTHTGLSSDTGETHITETIPPNSEVSFKTLLLKDYDPKSSVTIIRTDWRSLNSRYTHTKAVKFGYWGPNPK